MNNVIPFRYNGQPMLEHRVDEMRDRLQMVLGLDAASVAI